MSVVAIGSRRSTAPPPAVPRIKMAEQVERRRVGPVQVVEHEHHRRMRRRPPSRSRTRPRTSGSALSRVARPRRRLGGQRCGELGISRASSPAPGFRANSRPVERRAADVLTQRLDEGQIGERAPARGRAPCKTVPLSRAPRAQARSSAASCRSPARRPPARAVRPPARDPRHAARSAGQLAARVPTSSDRLRGDSRLGSGSRQRGCVRGEHGESRRR